MMTSPEFRRNLWLEFSAHRLAAMPVILGAVFLLLYLAGSRTLDANTGAVAGFVYILLIFLWGTRLATDTVVAEVQGHTWDQQRLSAIGAWPMAWGKLFGATAYAWYGGIFCMAFYGVSHATHWSLSAVLNAVALYIAAGIFAHALSLALSLQAIQRRRAFGRVQVLWFQVAAMVAAGIPLYSGLKGLELTGDGAMIAWYGYSMAQTHFVIVSLAGFAGWALTGVYALIRLELMHRHGPWLWLGFTMFAMTYFGGLEWAPWGLPVILTSVPIGLVVAFLVASGAAYAMAFGEPKTRVRLRRLAHYLRENQWRRALEHFPRSALTLLPVAGAAIAAALMADTSHFQNIAGLADVRLSILATVLFVVRDIGFIFVISLRHEKGSGLADARAFLYLVLAYTLLPALAQAIGAASLLGFFWPEWGEPAAWSIVPVLLEVAVIGGLLWRRWQNIQASAAEPS